MSMSIFWLHLSETYSEHYKTSKIERERSILDVCERERSILDVWQGSVHTYLCCWIWTDISNLERDIWDTFKGLICVPQTANQ